MCVKILITKNILCYICYVFPYLWWRVENFVADFDGFFVLLALLKPVQLVVHGRRVGFPTLPGHGDKLNGDRCGIYSAQVLKGLISPQADTTFNWSWPQFLHPGLQKYKDTVGFNLLVCKFCKTLLTVKNFCPENELKLCSYQTLRWPLGWPWEWRLCPRCTGGPGWRLESWGNWREGDGQLLWAKDKNKTRHLNHREIQTKAGKFRTHIARKTTLQQGSYLEESLSPVSCIPLKQTLETKNWNTFSSIEKPRCPSESWGIWLRWCGPWDTQGWLAWKTFGSQISSWSARCWVGWSNGLTPALTYLQVWNRH